jgi:hypothetical protein
MCWSAEVSLQTFIIGAIAISIFYALDVDAFIIALISCIIAIQLLEYFIWTHIRDRNKNKIRIYSILTYLVIMMQPIILLYFTSNRYRWLIPVYIILQSSILITFFLFDDIQYDFMPIVAPNGHLDWKWTGNKTYGWLMLAIYVVFLIGAIFLYGNWLLFALTIITFMISRYNYMMYNTVASMWCFWASIIIYIACLQIVWNKRKKM